MKQLLLFTVLSVTLNSFAQDTSYSKIYEPLFGELGYSYPVSDADLVWDEGLITSGLMSDGQNRSFLARISSVGGLMWQKAFGDNTISDSTVLFNQIITTSDSNFVAVGYYTDTSVSETRPFFMKLDPMGDTLWTRSFYLTNQNAGSFQDYYRKNGKVIEMSDTNFLLGFQHASFEQFFSNPDHLCLAKFNQNGDILWSKSFVTDSTFVLKEMIQAPDSSIYLVGSSGHLSVSKYGYLINLDSDGQLNWSRKYANLIFEDVDMDSNALFVTWSNEIEFNRGILKLDLNGNFLKRIEYYLNNSFGLGLNTDMRSNGNLVSTTVDSPGGFPDGFCEVSPNLDIVARYDIYMLMNELISIPNKGVYAVGFGPIYGVKAGDTEMGIVRLDSAMYSDNCSYQFTGNVTILDSVSWTAGIFMESDSLSFYQPDLVYTDVDFIADDGCVTFLGSVDEIEGSWNETVSPNPSAGKFTISWGEYRNAEVVIYNSMGQEVLRSRAKDTFIEFNFQAEQNGIYHYRLTDDNGSQSNGKLILMK
jgi:hypothetical protein